MGRARSAPALPAGFLAFTGPHGSAVLLLALLGAGVHRVARAAAEGVRRAWTSAQCGWASAANGVGAAVLRVHPGRCSAWSRACCIPSLPSPDLALPTVLVRDLPPAVGALALAAVFSAEVSAADAVLFMLSTSLSQDLYRRFLRPDASDATAAARSRAAQPSAPASRESRWRRDPDRDRCADSLLRAADGRALRADRRGAPRAPRRCAGSARRPLLAGVSVLVGVHLHTGRRGRSRGWPPEIVALVIGGWRVRAGARGRWSRPHD